MRRACPYRGENNGPGKDIHGEIDPPPGIREQYLQGAEIGFAHPSSSSARTSRDSGMSIPRALATCRLSRNATAARHVKCAVVRGRAPPCDGRRAARASPRCRDRRNTLARKPRRVVGELRSSSLRLRSISPRLILNLRARVCCTVLPDSGAIGKLRHYQMTLMGLNDPKFNVPYNYASI